VPSPKLFVVTEVYLSGTSWEDMGLEREESFTAPISSALKNWANEHLSVLGPAEVCLESCLNDFVEWESRPPTALKSEVKPEFQGAVWMKVIFDLKKKIDVYEWTGRIVLNEIETKSQLGNSDIPWESRNFRALELKDQNSALVTALFKSASSSLTSKRNELVRSKRRVGVRTLKVTGHRNVSEVLDLVNDFKTRGSGLGLSCALDTFQSSSAVVSCTYQGEEKSFTDFLSRPLGLKSKSNLKVQAQ
jgi:hypothetical protein